MPLAMLRICGYRSIRDLSLPLAPINVIVGPNGSGKTNLYRSLYLVHMAAQGQLARALATEGGMPSVLWAGDRSKGPVRLSLRLRLDYMDYELHLGLPLLSKMPSKFFLDPQVKEEHVYVRVQKSKAHMLERKDATVFARDEAGRRITYPFTLTESESVLAELREPQRFPELFQLRQQFLNWRFYHHFRVDAESPIRQPQVGTRTPILAHDGTDLAAALQTILEIGRGGALHNAIQSAFPGAELRIDGPTDISPQERFRFALKMPNFNRFFEAPELSDGTLHYLCLLAALLSPRPSSLLALNEPEGSLHPDLMLPLAQLLVEASQYSQIWLTTHSTTLAAHLQNLANITPIQLEKRNGETYIPSQKLSDLILK